MKKKLGVVLTTILSLAMATTAFAAESPTKGVSTTTKDNGDGSITTYATSEDGTKVTAISSSEVTIASGNVTLLFTDAEGRKLENVNVTIGEVSGTIIEAAVAGAAESAADASEVKKENVLAAVDVKVENFTEGKASIPLTVAGVSAGDPVYAICVLDGNVVFLDAVAEADGVVTVTATTSAPIIIMKGIKPQVAVPDNKTDDQTSSAGDKGSSSTTDSSIKAPKMGEEASVFMLLAAVSLLGGVFCTKKLVLNR